MSFGLTTSELIHLESVRVLLIEMNATGEVPNTVKWQKTRTAVVLLSNDTGTVLKGANRLFRPGPAGQVGLPEPGPAAH